MTTLMIIAAVFLWVFSTFGWFMWGYTSRLHDQADAERAELLDFARAAAKTVDPDPTNGHESRFATSRRGEQ